MKIYCTARDNETQLLQNRDTSPLLARRAES